MAFPVILWIAVCFTAETVLSTDTKKECKALTVENGHIIIEPNSRKINCDHGYRLLGEDQITCQPNGTWSKNPPYCQEITCPRILTLLNGTISPNPPRAKINATANIRCDDYHLLIGAERMTCTINGIWEPNRMLHCLEVRYPDFPSITHGSVKPNTLSRPGHVQISCDEGFKLNGESRLECTEDGKWHPNVVPSCDAHVECEACQTQWIVIAVCIVVILFIVGVTIIVLRCVKRINIECTRERITITCTRSRSG